MYYGEFSCEADVLREFALGSRPGSIIFAAYECGDYEGSAEVIYISQGRFYHVSGSHCSCHGLEECWQPEEMPLLALRHIVNESSYGVLSTMRTEVNEAIDRALILVGDLDGSIPEETLRAALRIAFD
jgi:hypothetical protein